MHDADTIIDIARVCHEVNRAYCAALGDHSQPPWEEAEDWQRESAYGGVRFHLEADRGPEASHESWMEHKIAHGWVYGERKDPDAKTHPCMVPFEALPPEQQAKDYIFRAVVHAMAECAKDRAKPRSPLAEPTWGEPPAEVTQEMVAAAASVMWPIQPQSVQAQMKMEDTARAALCKALAVAAEARGKIDDGGCAFPVNSANLGEGGACIPDPGMSMRDYFAGQALAGLFASGPHDCEPSELAFDAYLNADAMLRERKESRRR